MYISYIIYITSDPKSPNCVDTSLWNCNTIIWETRTILKKCFGVKYMQLSMQLVLRVL